MALTIIAIAGAAASAASAGYQIASAGGSAPAPNTAQAAWDAQAAKARALPQQRALAAAAQQGGQTEYWVPTHKEQREQVKIKGQGWVDYHAADWAPGGRYASLGTPNVKTRKVKVKGHTETADFTGYGTADVTDALTRQYADMEARLSGKYGTQFAAEAAREARLADPEGYAARQKMYQMIQERLGQEPEQPVAELLQQQVREQLAAGSRLDDMEREVLRAGLADAQKARGQTGATVEEFAAPLETGFEGQARRDAGIGRANRWLASGATPEDVAYRRSQQDLANLSAFVQGQSPVSQFPQLSAAQAGTTPVFAGQPGPALSNPDLAGASQFAIGNWQTAMQQALNTPNGWMTGIQALLKLGGGVAGAV